MSRKRVLIGIDSSMHSLDALDDAVAMAADLDAELVGFFVEDDNLLRLAALPCTTEVGMVSGRSRALNRGTVRRSFKSIADQARRALKIAAERQAVRWSFSVARGSVAGQLLRQLAENEEEAQRRTPGPIRHMGPHTVVLMQAQECRFPRGKAVIVMDTTYESFRGLSVSLELADHTCTERLMILVLADSMFSARAQQERVNELLRSNRVRAEFSAMPIPTHGELLNSLRKHDCGALIWSDCRETPSRDEMKLLLEETEFPVFVVR